jgi:hypothetical protein
VEGRALSLRDESTASGFVSQAGKPADKQDFRLLPPCYVALSQRQKEIAVAALAELILASMRRLEKVPPLGEEMSPLDSSLEKVHPGAEQGSRR